MRRMLRLAEEPLTLGKQSRSQICLPGGVFIRCEETASASKGLRKPVQRTSQQSSL